MKKLAFIGAGTHSDAVLPVASSYNYQFVGYFDDKDIKEYNGFPVLGKLTDVIQALDNKFVDLVFITIGDNAKRKEIFDLIHVDHYDKLCNFIAPSSIILNSDALLGRGIFIGHNVFLGADVTVGDNSIVNTGAIVEHHSVIGKNCNVAPGVIINGITNIADECYIGSGTTIIQCINLCSKVFTGAGTVVVNDIVEPGTYVGVPAKKIKKEIL